jgi:hypothetical protein
VNLPPCRTPGRGQGFRSLTSRPAPPSVPQIAVRTGPGAKSWASGDEIDQEGQRQSQRLRPQWQQVYPCPRSRAAASSVIPGESHRTLTRPTSPRRITLQTCEPSPIISLPAADGRLPSVEAGEGEKSVASYEQQIQEGKRLLWPFIQAQGREISGRLGTEEPRLTWRGENPRTQELILVADIGGRDHAMLISKHDIADYPAARREGNPQARDVEDNIRSELERVITDARFS